MISKKSEKVYTTKEFSKENFEKCCDYIRFNLLGHPQGTKCPSHIVLRVRGFCRGQRYARNSAERQEYEYDYVTLYATLVYCKDTILSYFKNNSKKISSSDDPDQYKVNLIFKFLDQKINMIHNKLKDKQKTETKLHNMEVNQLAHTEGAAYQKKESVDVELIDMPKDIEEML